MGILIAALEADGFGVDAINSQVEALENVAHKRPDLVKRYNEAIALRNGPEVERIWFQCQITNRELIHSVRINSVTGRVHFGHGRRSIPLVPPLN